MRGRRDPIERRLSRAGGISNLSGAFDLFLFGALLGPVAPKDIDRGELIVANALLFVPYMVLTLALGEYWGRRRFQKLRPWLESDRGPTPEERDAALRLPLAQALMSAGFWVGAAIVFTILNVVIAPSTAAAVTVLTLLGGTTTATMNYFLAERILRPITARALSAGLPERPVGPGVRGRVAIVW